MFLLKLPIVSSEWCHGQARGGLESTFRIVGPSVTDGYRNFYFRRVNDDLLAISIGCCCMELTVGASNGEALDIAVGCKWFTDVWDGEADMYFSVVLNHIALINWSLCRNFLTISISQCDDGQTASYFLFIFRVDIACFADIYVTGHARVFHVLGFGLCFT